MNSTSTLVVREREAANLLGVSVAALQRWRHERRGPPFIRLGRCIGYQVSDLESYIGANRVETKQSEEVANGK